MSECKRPLDAHIWQVARPGRRDAGRRDAKSVDVDAYTELEAPRRAQLGPAGSTRRRLLRTLVGCRKFFPKSFCPHWLLFASAGWLPFLPVAGQSCPPHKYYVCVMDRTCPAAAYHCAI